MVADYDSHVSGTGCSYQDGKSVMKTATAVSVLVTQGSIFKEAGKTHESETNGIVAKEKCKIFIDLPDPINAGDWLPRSNNKTETIVAGHSTITVSHCSEKKS